MTMTFKSIVILALVSGSLGAQDSTARPREIPPAPGTPKNFRVPPRRTFTLPNGLQVTLVPFGRIPKVAVELEIRTGIIDQGANDSTLPRLNCLVQRRAVSLRLGVRVRSSR